MGQLPVSQEQEHSNPWKDRFFFPQTCEMADLGAQKRSDRWRLKFSRLACPLICEWPEALQHQTNPCRAKIPTHLSPTESAKSASGAISSRPAFIVAKIRSGGMQCQQHCFCIARSHTAPAAANQHSPSTTHHTHHFPPFTPCAC